MNFRISIGLFMSLLVVLGGIFLVTHAQQLMKTVYVSAGDCPYCIKPGTSQLNTLLQSGNVDYYFTQSMANPAYSKFNPTTGKFDAIGGNPPGGSVNGYPATRTVPDTSATDPITPNQIGSEGPAHPGPTPPRTTGSVGVVTKYKVIPGVPAIPPHFCNTQYPGIKFIDLVPPVYVKGPDVEISLQKMCELAVNIMGGIQGVQLGSVAIVGSGRYNVQPTCFENKKPSGTPKSIQLKYETPSAFEVCKGGAANQGGTPNIGGSNSGGGGAGGGAGGAGGAGALGGLAQILPLLMQGLLGGGQGNQGNLGGQGQNGTNQGNVAIPCSAYGTSPVCGSSDNNKIYTMFTNSCYLQEYKAVQVSSGMCSTIASPSPSPTPDITKLITNLATSGVPTNLIISLQNVIAQILASVASGSSVGQVIIP